MSFRKMVNKLKNIVLGTYYNITNKKQDVAYPRLQICSSCVNSKIGWKINYCLICGCILKSKASIVNEKCPIGKW